MMHQHPAPTALVTGASRGIGRAIAIALGSAGYNVVINYHRNQQAAQDAAELVKSMGGNPLIVQADIGNLDDQKRLVHEAEQAFGCINLLVNNAGVAPKVRADLLEISPESYDFAVDTNLRGTFFLTQLIANQMLTQHDTKTSLGKYAIINISSISAYTPSINRAEYCIAKSGIAMMTQLFASRLAGEGINVYEVRPGIIQTDMTGPVKEKYDKLIFEQDLLPMPRWGQPTDIAKTILAIAKGYFPYSTGQVINVDGGFHLHRL